MVVFSLSRVFRRNGQPACYIVPAIAGCTMAGASVIPWLKDPLGESYFAWQLPVDVAWQLPTGLFNYGVLCLCCAVYTFFLAYVNWKACRDGHTPYSLIMAGFLYVVPTLLFLLQYLYIDLYAMSLLAQHEEQMTLVARHLGYSLAPELFPFNPFTVDISTLPGRFQLLVDQTQFGILVPLSGAWLLLD